MPPLQLLIKPASGECDFRCRYCFYRAAVQSRAAREIGMMPLELIGSIVKRAMERAERSVSFVFQGGEPMLAGLDFFRHAARMQKAINKKGLRVFNAIQTNGSLIDGEWARFFRDEGFLVGVSLDGYERLHDINRRDALGMPTFQKVMAGIDVLKLFSVEFNILTVVSAQSAHCADKIYRFFKKNGLLYQQFIPCLDPIGERGQKPYSLTPGGYTAFFTELFDSWFSDIISGEFIYIRHFENMLAVMRGYPPEHCGMSGRCAIQYAIEADGTVYPCDFYMYGDYYLGNLVEGGFDEIDARPEAGGFIKSSAAISPECSGCDYFFICRGGCRRDRDAGDGIPGLNYYCAAYKAFYRHAIPKLASIIERRGTSECWNYRKS
jgi:uncharacterized protein